MVWGLYQAATFGDFFLDGEFPGWDEILENHFHYEMSPNERSEFQGFTAYKLYVVQKYRRNYAQVAGEIIEHGPLEPHEMPPVFTLKTKRSKPFGSWVELPSRLTAVEEGLKTIIESLEPGVHEFWEMDFQLKNGDKVPTKYYGIKIRNVLKGFSAEQSDPDTVSGNGSSYFVRLEKKKYYSGIAISKDVIGGSHLWREVWLQSPEICFSDTLMQEIARTNLRLPKTFKLKEV